MKNIIPAIPSTNAVVAAACALETLKIATMCSVGMNNYTMCATLTLGPLTPNAPAVFVAIERQPHRRSGRSAVALVWPEASQSCRSHCLLLHTSFHKAAACEDLPQFYPLPVFEAAAPVRSTLQPLRPRGFRVGKRP